VGPVKPIPRIVLTLSDNLQYWDTRTLKPALSQICGAALLSRPHRTLKFPRTGASMEDTREFHGAFWISLRLMLFSAETRKSMNRIVISPDICGTQCVVGLECNLRDIARRQLNPISTRSESP